MQMVENIINCLKPLALDLWKYLYLTKVPPDHPFRIIIQDIFGFLLYVHLGIAGIVSSMSISHLHAVCPGILHHETVNA